MEIKSCDYLIVGGGIVGLTIAHQLVERKFTSNIIIIDKEVVYKEGKKSISFKPSKISLEIDFEINFNNELIDIVWLSC